MVVQPREILIDGKSPGTVSLIVWGADTREQYDVVVEPGVTGPPAAAADALSRARTIPVSVSDEAIILSGHVSSNAVMLRAGEIARPRRPPRAKVINMLQLPGGSESQQVMLQVRFAEVNRKALTELGVNLFAEPARIATGRSTTQQFAAPIFRTAQNASDPQNMVFSDFLNLFFFDRKRGHRRRRQGARSHVAGSRASPSRTSSPTTARKPASSPAARFPIPVVQGGRPARRDGQSTRSSASG